MKDTILKYLDNTYTLKSNKRGDTLQICSDTIKTSGEVVKELIQIFEITHMDATRLVNAWMINWSVRQTKTIKLIYDYMNSNYTITLKSYSNFKLVDTHTNIEKHIRDVMVELRELFSIDDSMLLPIFDRWFDEKATNIEVAITDLQEKAHKKGISLW